MIQQLTIKLLQQLDPELAHKLTIRMLVSGLTPLPRIASDPVLATTQIGLNFPNPLAIAAGFDKNGDVPDTLLRLGLGFAEVGTVTPKPQFGSQKPRVFRLRADRAIINRYGFNNEGQEAVLRKLSGQKKRRGIVGVNIGANKDSEDRLQDFVQGLKAFAPVADYLVVNVSSPNTPGLRVLQEKDELEPLLKTLVEERERLGGESKCNTPILVKISPDVDDAQLCDICQAVKKFKIDGLIVTNTSLARDNLQDTTNGQQSGGLSGPPIFAHSTKVLARTRQLAGPDLAIFGVGGIDSGKSAWEKITAGANLLQLYTGLTYRGIDLIDEILQYLTQQARLNNLENLQQAVGTEMEKWLG